ncbi:MAG: hypothetical protein HYW86_03840 [Candidatus Roizmanbacteria bacterium]|nr:MAG: hypothetical protein HYW86_03840 [Candidatus Roizmanbacteria bacterium]
MENIKGGYFMIARKIFESEIMIWPLTWFKIWIWLIGKANHTEVKKDGVIYKRGQTLTSYEEMREIGSYRVGYRKDKPTKSVIEGFVRRIKKHGMANTRKTVRGLWIEIVNYNYFQNSANYEIDNDKYKKTTIKRETKSTLNNNEEKENNEKNKLYGEAHESKQSSEEHSNPPVGIASIIATLPERIKSQPNIKVAFQEKSLRYAEKLDIDINDIAVIEQKLDKRWFKLFKDAENKTTLGKNIELAYSYLYDHAKFRTLNNIAKIKFFFWRVNNPDYKFN